MSADDVFVGTFFDMMNSRSCPSMQEDAEERVGGSDELKSLQQEFDIFD